MSRLAPLHEELCAYRPLHDDERGFLEQMQMLAARGEEALSRSTFDPGHFTASAFVLDPSGSDLLLILHGKLGRWLQPGGHVDRADASLVEAARREAREETGVEVEPALDGIFDVDVHLIPALGSEPAHRHFDVRFLFRAQDSHVEAATDARAARGAPLRHIVERTVRLDGSVERAARKLLAMDERCR